MASIDIHNMPNDWETEMNPENEGLIGFDPEGSSRFSSSSGWSGGRCNIGRVHLRNTKQPKPVVSNHQPCQTLSGKGSVKSQTTSNETNYVWWFHSQSVRVEHFLRQIVADCGLRFVCPFEFVKEERCYMLHLQVSLIEQRLHLRIVFYLVSRKKGIFLFFLLTLHFFEFLLEAWW